MTAGRFPTLVPAVTAIAGIIVTYAVFHPGVMSPDSIGAYRQAVTGVIEGHTKTPLLAFIWTGVIRILPGPAGMLLLLNLGFWSGLAMIVSACRLGAFLSSLLILAIGLFPTVFALLGMIWSDVLLVAALTLFVGVALAGRNRRSRWLLAVALVPLWLGLSARVNALPAVVPLAVWWVTLWRETTGSPALVRAGNFRIACLALVLALLATSKTFDRLVIDRGSGSFSRSMQFVFFHDLAGLAVHSGDLRMPSRVYRTLPNMSLALIRRVYDPADVNLLVYNEDWDSSAFLTTDRAEYWELVRVWAAAIAAHPGAYLTRRAEAVATILQIRGTHYSFHTGIDPNEFGLVFERRPLYERVTQWLLKYDGVFFRGWVFALLSALVVVIGARARRSSAVAVCASGLLYVIPVVVVTTGSDFRYIWWMVVSSLIGALLVFGDRRTRAVVGAPAE